MKNILFTKQTEIQEQLGLFILLLLKSAFQKKRFSNLFRK